MTISLKLYSKSIYLLLVCTLFVIATFISCEQPIEYNNPFDPKVAVAGPGNLHILSMEETTLELYWEMNLTTLNEEQLNLIKSIVEQSLDGKNFTAIDTVGDTTSTANISEEFVTGQKYYFRIYTIFGSKSSPYSNVVVGEESSTYAPSNFRANSISVAKCQLSWKDNSTSEIGFEIQRKTGISGSFSVITELPPNSENFTDTTVVYTDTTYYYKLSATFKNNKSSPSDTLSITIPFRPPSDLHMTCLSKSSVMLEWKDGINFDGDYLLYESVNSQPFMQVTILPSSTTSFTVTGLNSANSYKYKVQAKTRYNFSKYSNTLSISYVTSQTQYLYSTFITRSTTQVSSLDFSPDGKLLACGGEKFIDIIRVSDGMHLASLEHIYNYQVYSVKFSPDGNMIAAAHGGEHGFGTFQIFPW